jgi:hypothetical protein
VYYLEVGGLTMPEELPKDERATLYYIAALIKNYEPQFELRGNFTPGLFSHSDPHYPAVRKEWLHALVRNGHLEKRLLSFAEAEDDLMDYGSDEADSRLNWRITFQHAFYLIHIMALDKAFQRFALSVQTKSDFDEGLVSIHKRPPCLRYEVVSRLSEVKPILADIYERFKGEEEESRQQDRIDKAVAKERERWVRRLAGRQRLEIIYFFIFAALLVMAIWLGGPIHTTFGR